MPRPRVLGSLADVDDRAGEQQHSPLVILLVVLVVVLVVPTTSQSSYTPRPSRPRGSVISTSS